jgi:hypothetical protein
MFRQNKIGTGLHKIGVAFSPARSRVVTAMNTKPKIATPAKVFPHTDRLAETPRTHSATDTLPVAAPETLESIEVRATSVTVVLQKIMTSGGGYRHGGLND